LSSTGSGVNWINATSSASIIYQDGFTGDGSTTAFTLANSLDNENKTQVYIEGVYQHKDNYSLSGTTLTFSSAPPNTSDIEVISFSSVSAADDILYDDDFTSAGLMTTDGSGVYSITTNNSSNWNTAYTHSQAAHAPANAEQNVQSDWTATSGDSFIQNKPATFTPSQHTQLWSTITSTPTTLAGYGITDTIPSGNQIIDWTTDQGSTEIHSGNYINTTYTVGDGGLTQNNFTDALKTKLDNIEASADVTDTTNVTAAGALMDSELTDLAGIKAVTISDLATETYVDTAVSDLVDSSPATLNTLNELAAALGDDPNFATTTATSIGTKLPLAGGTMTGGLTITTSNSPGLKISKDRNTDNRFLRFNDTGTSGKDYDIINNGNFALFNHTDNNYILQITDQGNATFSGKVVTTEVESSGSLLLDAATDITIDAGGQDIILSDDGTIFGTFSNSSGFQIRSRVNNADMFFRGVDGGTEFNALTLDMSENGNATFSGKVRANNWFQSADGTNTLYSNATSGTLIQTPGSTANNNDSKIYFRNSGLTVKHTFDTNNGNATFAGTITASGYNDSNWNTAYGWGDHELSAQDKTDIGNLSGINTGDQDLSGYSITSHNHDGRYLRTHARYQNDLDTITTSGVYIWDVSYADDEPTGASDGLLTIKYWDSSDWATASFQDFHNRKLYIKSKKSGTWQTDWAQVWTTDQLTTTNKTNYDTAYTYSQVGHLPLTGGTVTGDITISSTSPELKIVDTNSFTDTDDRWIVRGGANTLIMRWYDNSASSNTDVLTLSSTGASLPGAITASEYYDTNTTYFVNPSSTSELRHLKLKAAGDLDLYVSDNDAWVHCDARNEGSVAALYKYARSTSTGYGYYREYWYDGNSYQNIRCYNDTFEFSSGISTADGNLEINALDGGGAPAMTSQFTMKGYEGRGIGIKMKDNVHSASGSSSREWFVGSGYNTSNFNIGYSATGSQSSYPAQAMLNISTDGNVIATTSLRAPIFYDTDNTAYYTDPGSTSRTNTIISNLFSGDVSTSGDGQNNQPFRLRYDYNAWMMSAASNTWGLFWAGNSGARYGTNGNGGPGNIFGNSGNPNEFCFVGSDSTVWTIYGNDGRSWQAGYATNAASYRAPVFYDSSNTAYYTDPASTSDLNVLNIQSGNIDLRYAHTVDMTGSGYNQSTYYPVRIYVSDITRIRIENRLNAGGTHPSWASHGSGFSLLMDWHTNGSGWGTVGVTRTIRQWNEAWTNATICGGITQMTNSSQEVVWLRGGGTYKIRTSFNNTVQVQTSAYTANGQTVTPTTSIVNDVYSAASGSFSAGGNVYAGSSYAAIFYDRDDTTYYGNFGSTGTSLKVRGTAEFSTSAGNLRGYIRATDTNDEHFIIATSGGEDIAFKDGGTSGTTNMIIRGDGDAIITRNLYASAFYDQDNTGYYVNPNATSKLAGLEFNFTQHGSANNIRMGNSTTMDAISSGTNNAAFGVEALGGCSTGSRNFAYGYAALKSLTSGSSNIAMGDATGYNVSSGSNNLLFGQNAGRTGYQSPYQSIAGVSTASNQIHMGNESHSTARIQISWTVNSDARDKTDVTPINVGLDFVKDLNPVTFRWDKRSDYEDRTPTGENKLEELTLGFLAQEVETVEKSYGYDVANKTNLVVDRDVEQDHFGITYEKMIPILTKAIQELEARVQELENN
jgi:hypothetical protein